MTTRIPLDVYIFASGILLFFLTVKIFTEVEAMHRKLDRIEQTARGACR